MAGSVTVTSTPARRCRGIWEIDPPSIVNNLYSNREKMEQPESVPVL
jgi:hypothetical protein